MKTIRGITLKQPWAWAIRNAGKRVENRTWAPPESMLGNYLAIHAGNNIDREGLSVLRERFSLSLPESLVCGAIVAVARLDYVVDDNSAGNDPWYGGPFGWHLDDVTPIEHVACSGARRLWNLPPSVLRKVRANWNAAIAVNGTRKLIRNLLRANVRRRMTIDELCEAAPRGFGDRELITKAINDAVQQRAPWLKVTPGTESNPRVGYSKLTCTGDPLL